MTYDLRTPSGVKSPTQGTCFPLIFAETTSSVILVTRTRVDCQSSSEDRCEAVCWRRAGEANVSDMAAQLDRADSEGLLRGRPCPAVGCCVLSGEHSFSEEQKQMYVECRSGVNGRPRHGGTRWLESDLERQASSWTTSRCVEVKQRASTPRGGGVATRNSV